MINLSKTSISNLDGAIRGMRNPLNSWDKTDSFWDGEENKYIVGPKDMVLANKLVAAGSDHRKFMRQIHVCVDINAPLYFWKQFDTYKVSTVSNSCSTMHTIHKRPFTLEDFSSEYTTKVGEQAIHMVINTLNVLRQLYLETKDKEYWYNIIQLLPSSYNQLRTCTLNYEVVLSMYRSRKLHKLDEWRAFCEWIETLPYAKEWISYERD